MMKTVLIVIALMSAGLSQAQYRHVVILKNGSEIRGKILETDSSHTKITTKDGSIWSFQSNKIAGIERFQPKVSGKGVFVRVESGIVGGSQVSPSVLITNGYSFNAHWDVGLAMGYEHYWWDGYIPFMANARYNLLNNYFTPFMDVLVGYQMPLGNWDNNKGGVTTGARIGFTRYLGNRVGFSTSLGYRFAYLKEESGWWDDNVTLRSINRFEIKFGLTFK